MSTDFYERSVFSHSDKVDSVLTKILAKLCEQNC